MNFPINGSSNKEEKKMFPKSILTVPIRTEFVGVGGLCSGCHTGGVCRAVRPMNSLTLHQLITLILVASRPELHVVKQGILESEQFVNLVYLNEKGLVASIEAHRAYATFTLTREGLQELAYRSGCHAVNELQSREVLTLDMIFGSYE